MACYTGIFANIIGTFFHNDPVEQFELLMTRDPSMLCSGADRLSLFMKNSWYGGKAATSDIRVGAGFSLDFDALRSRFAIYFMFSFGSLQVSPMYI